MCIRDSVETVEYFNKLRLCGIPATVDVYRSDTVSYTHLSPLNDESDRHALINEFCAMSSAASAG